MENGSEITQATEKNELDNIMEQFIDVEYDLIALLMILNALEEYYNYEEKKELQALITVIIKQLNLSQADISKAISKMDSYIANNR